MSWSSRFRVGVLACCTMLAGVLASRPAVSAPIDLAIVPDAAALNVPQNTLGTVDFFTVTLNMGSTINVGFSSFNALNPLFLNSDGLDTVINARIGTAGNGALLPCSTARALQPGQSCVIQLIFDTRDTRDPDPDKIPGVWSEVLNVVAFEVGNPNNAQGFNPSVQITVTDPVPEPASFTVLATALVGLGLVRRTRRV